MKQFYWLILTILTTGYLHHMYAGPAWPELLAYDQPDGTTIQVRLCGDERFSYYLSSDGLPLWRSDDGSFYYAEISDGVLRSTVILAHDDIDRVDAFERAFVSAFDPTLLATTLQSLRRDAARNSKMAPLRRVPAFKRVETTVEPHQQRALAILVEFPEISSDDQWIKFTVPDPKELFYDMLNARGFSHDGATGSVSDYFRASSNGLLDLQFDLYGPVELYYDISYYGKKIDGEELNAWHMAYEACTALDDEIDFTQYDTDGDGVIDNVYIFYAGQSEANGGPEYTVWPHAADIETITGEQYLFDGVRLNHYACSNEIWLVRDPDSGLLTPRLQGIGAVCHEFSHILGLLDLYDVTGAGAYTPGAWSLMDIGSYNNDTHTPPLLSSYEQYALGWLMPTLLTPESANYTLPPLTTSYQAYMIPTIIEDEYFFIENRQQSGWDSALPGHGMLVWHIDYDPDIWARNEINSDPSHQRIDLVEAGGDTGWAPRSADPFPGTTQQTALALTPWISFAREDGEPVSYDISSITETVGGDITFQLNDKDSSIPSTSIAQYQIVVSGDLLQIAGCQAPELVTIVDSSGVCLLSTIVTDGRLSCQITTAGVYIVTVGGTSSKIKIGS